VTSTRPKIPNFEPQVVVLYCQCCVSEDAEVTTSAIQASGFALQSVMMPCSSKIETSYILNILGRGVDAVEVVACPSESCRFLVGSLRAEKRIAYIRGLLDEAHIGAERVGISHGSKLSAEQLMDLAASRAQAARALGPNPIKMDVRPEMHKGEPATADAGAYQIPSP
jgi:F420-non-reducing hydrogenase iron-sulfur subunit